MIDKLLDEMQKRCDAATDGPWHHGMSIDRSHNLWRDDCTDVTSPDAEMRPADADFCAHARTDVPGLIEALRYLLDEGLCDIDKCNKGWHYPETCDCASKNIRIARQEVARILTGEGGDDGKA